MNLILWYCPKSLLEKHLQKKPTYRQIAKSKCCPLIVCNVFVNKIDIYIIVRNLNNKINNKIQEIECALKYSLKHYLNPVKEKFCLYFLILVNNTCLLETDAEKTTF